MAMRWIAALSLRFPLDTTPTGAGNRPTAAACHMAPQKVRVVCMHMLEMVAWPDLGREAT